MLIPAPTAHTGRKIRAARDKPVVPAVKYPATVQTTRTAKPIASTFTVCIGRLVHADLYYSVGSPVACHRFMDSEPISSGTPAYRKLSLALLIAGFATFSLLYSVQSLLPIFAQSFKVSAAEASLVVSLA